MTLDLEKKLDELHDDIRQVKASQDRTESDMALVRKQVVSQGLTIAEHGQRIADLEATKIHAPRGLSHSVTSELSSLVGSAVGESIRVAAPDMTREIARASLLSSLLRSAAAGAVLGLAIIVWMLINKH